MAVNNNVHRLTLRLTDEEFKLLEYWAARREMSINEYMIESLSHMIKRENGDYDLPTAEIARLNQLIEVVMSLSSNVKSLENVTVSGFDSLLGLTRGDNYLLEHEDGEI